MPARIRPYVDIERVEASVEKVFLWCRPIDAWTIAVLIAVVGFLNDIQRNIAGMPLLLWCQQAGQSQGRWPVLNFSHAPYPIVLFSTLPAPV